VSETVELLFHVKGSAPEPYSLKVTVIGTGLVMKCNCMAGVRGNWCKHKAALLAGEMEQLVSLNRQDVATLTRLIPLTSAAVLANELAQAEKDLEIAERRVKSCRTALARAVAGD
jgi:uncharacterized Zn finger protein